MTSGSSRCPAGGSRPAWLVDTVDDRGRWGGAAGERGALLRQLLPVLREAAVAHGFDVALVLRGPSDPAAAQRVRRGEDGGRALPPHLVDLAERLGEQARRGQLAVFIGAGVSAAAGLRTCGSGRARTRWRTR